MSNPKSKPMCGSQRPARKSRRCFRVPRQSRQRLFLETLEPRLVLSGYDDSARDLWRLFQSLRSVERDEHDDGTVGF